MRELPNVNNTQILVPTIPESEGNFSNTNHDLTFLKMHVGLRTGSVTESPQGEWVSEPRRAYPRLPLPSPRWRSTGQPGEAAPRRRTPPDAAAAQQRPQQRRANAFPPSKISGSRLPWKLVLNSRKQRTYNSSQINSQQAFSTYNSLPCSFP